MSECTSFGTDFENGLASWLGGEATKSEEHKRAIVNVVGHMFDLHPKITNGHSKEKEETVSSLPVFCTPLEDLYIKSVGVFVDVFHLIPIFEKLAFKPHGNLILKGPKGDGKSLSVRTHTFTQRVPLVVVECSENTKDSTLLGSFVLVGKQTVFNLGPIPKAIKTANEVGRCTLLFEEFNALTPQSQKMLNGVAQERKIEVPAIGKTFELKDGCEIWIVGTMNPSIYGGTYDVNEDLKSRFGEIDISYAAHAHEKAILKAVCPGLVDDATLDNLLKFAKESRAAVTGYAISTRDLVRTVHTINELGLQPALQMLACKFEGEDRNVAIARMAPYWNVKITKTWGESPGGA